MAAAELPALAWRSGPAAAASTAALLALLDDLRAERERLAPAALLDVVLEPLFEQMRVLHRRQGMSPARARAHARLGVAAVRGLLLDLIATEDRRGVDQAMKLQIELYELDLDRNASR